MYASEQTNTFLCTPKDALPLNIYEDVGWVIRNRGYVNYFYPFLERKDLSSVSD